MRRKIKKEDGRCYNGRKMEGGRIMLHNLIRYVENTKSDREVLKEK